MLEKIAMCCFEDYEKLLNYPEIDIVYITLPNTFHFFWTIQAIKNHKRILIEKPAFLNLEQVQIVKQKIEEKKIFFTEGFFYRHLPHIGEIIKIINENEIGELTSMDSSFGLNLLTKKKLFFLKKKKKLIHLQDYLIKNSLVVASWISDVILVLLVCL